jgi:3-oxoacyl-[acyl-carrier protein] reductase
VSDPVGSERVVVITGAAGGLGASLTNVFASGGWRVAAGWHRAVIQTANERIFPIALDVSDSAKVEAAVAQILERWQRIDVLINNAGITSDNLLATLPEADWTESVNINLTGAFRCSRAVSMAMLRRREGHIINISSFSARAGHAGQAHYAAAKAGLIGLTQSLAKEIGKKNVRVNAVLPGLLPTAMTAALSEERRGAMAIENVLGRSNTLDEVSRFIAFLADTRNISGQVFQLDSRVPPWT